MIVAVDGPSGAGKSSVCREVARRMGFVLIDTGALYRAMALMASREQATLTPEALGVLASSLSLSFVPGEGEQRLECNGEDISEQIRTAEISQRTSQISQHSPVRDALLGTQRALGRRSDSIVEGRDIGTVVFPDADLKVFYTASDRVRATRRWKELQERGERVSLDEVERELRERDARDRERDVAPLRQAEDAILLDTSGEDFEGACQALIALIEAARG